ncbi:hypothetical protein B9Z55_006010 [Caenorhabditis nigoni]|nr:hypothetical protein B9Z55_006010 [Caenorhabditis nigoni]
MHGPLKKCLFVHLPGKFVIENFRLGELSKGRMKYDHVYLSVIRVRCPKNIAIHESLVFVLNLLADKIAFCPFVNYTENAHLHCLFQSFLIRSSSSRFWPNGRKSRCLPNQHNQYHQLESSLY